MPKNHSVKTRNGFGQILKKAFFSDSFKAVAVLALIALVASLTLSVVHRFTTVDEAARLREKIGEAYTAAEITSELDIEGYENTENSVILNAFIASDGACIIVSKSKKAYNAGHGITLFVVIKDGIINSVANYSSAETPGLGTRALNHTYLSQYEGVAAEELAYRVVFASPSDTPSVNIRYLSGATKTSVGVKTAVEAAATFYIREVVK